MALSEEEEFERHQLAIHLPEPTIEDMLYDKKKALLHDRGLRCNFQTAAVGLGKSNFLDHVLETARILKLSETEWYFLEDDEKGPISLRNELEALGMLYSTLSGLLVSVGSDQEFTSLKALQNIVTERLNLFASSEPAQGRNRENCEEVEAELIAWAIEQGIQSKLKIIEFEGFGRGGAAATDINVGDLVLEIPMESLIYERTALNSSMGAVLSQLEGLSGETLALLWTIKERHTRESKFATYFVSSPTSFNTGLSFTMEGLKELEGALVLEEILQAKEHLRRQYDALFPALVEAFPETFLEQIYTWENFLWASELWYSNGVKVVFPDGTFKACLIPVAGILNHSVYPHITHYSRIDAATSTLKLHAIRPCKCGEQCFLSYGALSSSDLLMFYGFVLRDDNPYDTIPLELDMPEPSSSAQKCELLSRYNITSSHMLRATWLCKSASTKNRLPSRLLAALRIIFMEESEVQVFEGSPRYRTVSPANEKAVFEALLMIVEPLLAPFKDLDGHSRLSGDSDSSTTENWDVKLAVHFKDQQSRILSSLQRSCIESLQE